VTLVVCTGTGTEVGKTWIGARVLETIHGGGRSVAARKPVQSFDPASTEPTDADVLARATGDQAEEICPSHRWIPVAMAPPMAAHVLGRPPFTIADLVSELRWPAPEPHLAWLEGVGGVRSPLADDGDTTDLCRAVGPDVVVLVADAGLGTINAVLLSMAALDCWPVLVVLNRFDEGNDLHVRNRAWLLDRAALDVVTGPAALAERLLSLQRKRTSSTSTPRSSAGPPL
jgi:dethiobiotin synthetase